MPTVCPCKMWFRPCGGNLNLPGGYAQTGTWNWSSALWGSFAIPAILRINLTTPAGSTVKLSEIARLRILFVSKPVMFC